MNKLKEARLSGNREKLREFGKKGADSRKSIQARRKQFLVWQAHQMMRQGNEHICPVGD